MPSKRAPSVFLVYVYGRRVALLSYILCGWLAPLVIYFAPTLQGVGLPLPALSCRFMSLPWACDTTAAYGVEIFMSGLALYPLWFVAAMQLNSQALAAESIESKAQLQAFAFMLHHSSFPVMLSFAAAAFFPVALYSTYPSLTLGLSGQAALVWYLFWRPYVPRQVVRDMEEKHEVSLIWPLVTCSDEDDEEEQASSTAGDSPGSNNVTEAVR